MIAYYDLSRAPVTADFAHFLVAAAAHAKGEPFDLAIVADRFRVHSDREKAYGDAERQWRIWNLLLDFAQVVPQLRNVSLLRERPATVAADCYPPNYDPHGDEQNQVYSVERVRKYHTLGRDVQVFRPSEYALEAARKILGGDELLSKVVTISPRTATWDKARNSRLDDWAEFARLLTERGFRPVLIPDQDDALGARLAHLCSDWQVLDAAAMSIDLRLAIYSLARMNYAANGGLSAGLLPYSKAPFRWYSIVVEKSRFASLDVVQICTGLAFGEQYPWLQRDQRMMWVPDTLANLTVP